MEFPDLVRFFDVPMSVDAILPGPALRVRDLLALRIGSVIATETNAGDNITVVAGDARLGIGELTALNRKVVVKMLRFGEEA